VSSEGVIPSGAEGPLPLSRKLPPKQRRPWMGTRENREIQGARRRTF
jgi:hypothetical protein